MDLNNLEARIDNGEKLHVTYNYPAAAPGTERVTYRTRTDRLLAVEPSNGRFFVKFRGELPVWIESHEVVRVESEAKAASTV